MQAGRVRETIRGVATPASPLVDPSRRAALQQLAGPAALLAAPGWLATARAAGLLRLTPAQTEGPFYPVDLPADTDADLLANGERRYLRGQSRAAMRQPPRKARPVK